MIFETLIFTGMNSFCDSRFGGFASEKKTLEKEVQVYINSQLAKSYEYLLLATYFNSYQTNRPGFQKLYQGLSDRSFDDSIELIKQITRRGGEINFNTKHKSDASVESTKTLEVTELNSLAIALDNEKQLSRGAMHVHQIAAHSHKDQSRADPEMTQYMEEKFLSSQASTVRKLSGYANDLAKLMNNGPDASLSIYLFDEYLQKQ